jgi:hypothetical protein
MQMKRTWRRAARCGDFAFMVLVDDHKVSSDAETTVFNLLDEMASKESADPDSISLLREQRQVFVDYPG